MADQEQAHILAGKLAQLLAETQVTAAPHLAAIDHAEKWRQTEDWLERLETHAKGQVSPILEHILANSSPPEFLMHLFAEAMDPPEQFSAIIEQIFVYGFVANIVGTSIQPFLQGVSNELSTAAVSTGIERPIDPAIIATAIARGLEKGAAPTTSVPDWAYSEAAKSGIGADDVNLRASIVGTPPAPQELFELLRRDIIDEDRLEQGMREGDTRDDWITDLAQLAHGWLTPLDFVRAAVQGQMSYEEAAAWASKTGLDTSTSLPIDASDVGGSDDMFGLAWAIAGRPPGPQELAAMTLRGIIPKDGLGAGALSFQQGIAESDVKTKWTDSLYQLAQYLPPPNEIGTLLERGGITKDQAVALWEQRGVPTEIANAYAYITEQQHITQDKLLAKGTILTAYFDQLVDHDEATELLGDLGYSGTTASTMLSVQDFRRVMTARNAVVRRISTLYGEGKLSATDAKSALVTVGIDSGQADNILSNWEALRVQPIHLPTASEIGAAVKYGTIDQATGLKELAALGYQDRDAAIVLSAHAEAQVTPLPGAGSTVTG